MVYGGTMARKQSEDLFSEQETVRRLEAVLQAAFAGAPTPLKDIPTRRGEQRSERKPQPRKRRRQRKKRAA